MKISLIAALSKNRVIGKENQLPWRIPEDLKRFKEITLGKPVIMGRKTFVSIGHILPNRPNIIVSRQTGFQVEGAEVVSSLNEAFERARTYPNSNEVMVIGGAEIYKQAIELADRLYLTEIHSEIAGDSYFPHWDEARFREVTREDRSKPISFSFR
ncbi:MAG: dihydrofolate reductase, partial [Bdellovibrionota bacterium]